MRSLLDITSINELPNRPIDFVLVFPQAVLDVDVFMHKKLEMLVDENRVEWFLNLNKSIYGLKQEIENWFDLLKTSLKFRGYHQSKVDPCVFYRKDSVIFNLF